MRIFVVICMLLIPSSANPADPPKKTEQPKLQLNMTSYRTDGYPRLKEIEDTLLAIFEEYPKGYEATEKMGFTIIFQKEYPMLDGLARRGVYSPSTRQLKVQYFKGSCIAESALVHEMFHFFMHALGRHDVDHSAKDIWGVKHYKKDKNGKVLGWHWKGGLVKSIKKKLTKKLCK